MKPVALALALATLASPSFALPLSGQGLRDAAMANPNAAPATVQTVRYRPHHRGYFMYRYGMRFSDPDPRVRDYLRYDPPGNQWE
jgi:hypothetical protein